MIRSATDFQIIIVNLGYYTFIFYVQGFSYSDDLCNVLWLLISRLYKEVV